MVDIQSYTTGIAPVGADGSGSAGLKTSISQELLAFFDSAPGNEVPGAVKVSKFYFLLIFQL